ncbi:hypothetical protein PLICRDRAFT_158597 [Plicaturopsis crispa FD-325 SS-3]|nr:hypothetical protein PLICRDRAFT_158597 [Plicaturopsis crispa FD-325 SS-3]
MPSFLSRIRNRAISQTTSVSSQSVGPPVTSPSAPATVFHPVVDRRILRDVSSLFDSYAAEDEHAVETPKGLKPSARRSSGVFRPVASSPAVPRARDVLDEEAEELGAPPPDAIPQSEDEDRQGSRFNISLGPRAWSTFGRSRTYTSPREGSDSPTHSPPRSRFGSPRPGSPRRTYKHSKQSSLTTSSRLAPPSRPSTTGPPPSSYSTSIPSAHDSKRSSPANTLSSQRSPQTPVRSHSTQSDFSPSFASPDIRSDSRATFGFPTPPEVRSSSFSFGNGSLAPASTPIVENSELGVSISRRSKSSVDAPQPSARAEPSATFPRRSPRKHFSSVGASSSLPTKLGRPSRPDSSSSPVHHLFTDLSHGRWGSQSSTSRPGANSSHERRPSADWMVQATEDAGSWPAQVTREMLRLSLSEDAVSSHPPRPAGRHDHVDREHRAHHDHVPAPRLGSPSFPSHPPLISPSFGSHSLQQNRSPGDDHQSRFSFSGGATDNSKSNLRRNTTDTIHDTRLTHTTDHHRPERFMAHEEQSGGNGRSRRYVKGKSPTARRQNAAPAPATPSTSKGTPPRAISYLPVPSSSSFTSPISETSPIYAARATADASAVGTPVRIRSESSTSKGKRKADEVEGTPPDLKKEAQHATFAEVPDVRANRPSASSHAPSSYQRKRARLSAPLTTPTHSRPTSAQQQIAHAGSWSSRASSRAPPPHPSRAPSRAASTRSHINRPESREPTSRRSMSQVSIPISALISPHAPSVSRSTTFHMRDPRKPQRVQATSWSLRFGSEDEVGSPMQAWCFFLGFVLFPAWWIASLWRTPRTRHVGGSDTEKAVTLDDPQIEHDSKSWRLRCRVMSLVSFVTYIPFIVLVAIFAPR